MAAIKHTLPVVLHEEFGGFALTARIHELLVAREVSWLEKCGPTSDGRWYLPAGRDDLRCDPDLVEVVAEVTQEFEQLTEGIEDWRERKIIEQRLLHGLKTARVLVLLTIDELNSRERVIIEGWTL